MRVLRSWDAAKGDGTQLESTEIAGGILAAARAGADRDQPEPRLRRRDLPIELAVNEAVASGSLVVAASGNDGDRGSPLGYPAAFSARHDRRGHRPLRQRRRVLEPLPLCRPRGARRPTSSSRARSSKNWRPARARASRRRSSRAPRRGCGRRGPSLTAGQVAEILRRSARDIAPAGRDSASGLRDAERRGGARAPGADRAIRTSRTTTSTRSTRPATDTWPRRHR